MTSRSHSFDSRSCAAHLLVFAGALLTPDVLLGQESGGAESGALEEVTVTARFREEPLQRTPLAITAITGDSLELRNATNVVDIGKYSPNVTINPLGAGYGPT